jgi:hypothetical protein
VTSTAGGDSGRLGWCDSGGAPWAAVNSLELRSKHYGAWQRGFLVAKQSGGIAGSYQMVLDDGHGSKWASGGGNLSPISQVAKRYLQGVSSPQSLHAAAAASPQAHRPLQFP